MPLIPTSLHLVHQHRHLATFSIFGAVSPCPIVSNAPNRVIQPDGAAGRHVHLCVVEGTLPEQCNTTEWGLSVSVTAIAGVVLLLAGAFVQGVEINPMLQGTLFNELTFGDTFVIADEAVGEPEGPDDRGARGSGGYLASVWRKRQVCGAEEEDIANALLGAMFALDCGGLVGYTRRHASQFSILVSTQAVSSTYLAINDRSKSIRSLVCSITGSTSCCRQSRASGHLLIT